MLGIHKFTSQFGLALAQLKLDEMQKVAINESYIASIEKAELTRVFIKILYIWMATTATVGSILVTAFMSVSASAYLPGNAVSAFFWVAWGINIIVLIANKLLYLFGIQKRYIIDQIILEDYYSEGWQFVTRSGNYKEKTDHECFLEFMERIDKIKKKLTESAISTGSASKYGYPVVGGPVPVDLEAALTDSSSDGD